MPTGTGTRKPHNKTRLGCSQCKRRRIKCDCNHPKCHNCEKRGEECSFILLAPSTRLTAGPAPLTPITASTAPSVPSSSSSASASPSSSISFPISPLSSSGIPILPKKRYEVRLHKQTMGSDARTRSSSYTCSPPTTPLPLMVLPDLLIPNTFPPISPYIRFNDSWKTTRESLPPALQGILYHYEYTTSLTIADVDPAKAAWQTVIPELAATHKFLVHNILAIASLHLARLHGRSNERQTMVDLAASQMNKAITRFRPELNNINASNAAALFAAATLTAVYFFRTATQEMEDLRASVLAGTVTPPRAVVDRMLAATLRTIWGLRGPWTVLMPGWDHVVNGKLNIVTNRDWWPRDRVPTSARALDEDRRLARIEALWKAGDPGPGGPHDDCLSAALFYLREAYALVSLLTVHENEFPYLTSVDYALPDGTIVQMKDRGAIFVWATRISRAFLGLLEAKNRDALVILAHYAVLAGRVRNVWWLEGMGANFIITVAMALGRENWHLIEWPVHVVGVDLENAFTARPDLLEGLPGELAMEVV